jgi:hypothetical protein
VIVATTDLHRQTVLETIHDLGLELQVIFNKGSVMVLPSGVNKATGLATALTELGLSLHNVVGVGDAENDHAFMKVCECSAAVANALPAVKDTADIVLKGKRGAGVSELIERLLANDLSDQKTLSRHRIYIGTSENEAEHHIDPAGAGIMVCGTSGSGKSTLTTSILEQLTDQEYQVLVVDPEGDYTNLGFAHIIGSSDQAPKPEDIIAALRDPKRSVVANLLGVPLSERPMYFDLLVPRIIELKARTARPHWLVIDEAHHLLQKGPKAASISTSLPDRGSCFITVHPGTIEPKVLDQIQTLLIVGGQPIKTLSELCLALNESVPNCPTSAKDVLPAGSALLWRRPDAEAILIKTKSPRLERKRHSRKYAEGNLGPERSFYFRGRDGKLKLRASNLHLFLQLADGVDDDTWEFHCKAGEYSKWVRTEIKDNQLANELAEIENDARISPADSRTAVRAAVESRYTLPTDTLTGLVD